MHFVTYILLLAPGLRRSTNFKKCAQAYNIRERTQPKVSQAHTRTTAISASLDDGAEPPRTIPSHGSSAWSTDPFIV